MNLGRHIHGRRYYRKKRKKTGNLREQREGNNHEQGTTLESRYRTTTRNIINKCYQNIV